MDVDTVNRVDWERRRKIRLAQVREQSKSIAKSIRDRVHGAVESKSSQYEVARKKTEHKFKSLAISKLKSDFNYLIQDVGHGYSVASDQTDPSIVLAEKRLINRCKAISRGAEAEKRHQRVQDAQQMDKEMKERKIHFNRTVEKIRSTLITNMHANIGNTNNQLQNFTQHNECFLIPSQVTLNESNIMNWNHNKVIKTASKPWSMVINPEQDKMPHINKSTLNDDNKENKPTFKKIETNLKDYESLLAELNTLSTEEQKIKNNLFAYSKKEIPISCNNCISPTEQKNTQHEDVDKTQYFFNGNTKISEEENQITGKELCQSSSSSSIVMSAESIGINNNLPVKLTKKTTSFKNDAVQKNSKLKNVKISTCKNNTIQSNSKLNNTKKSTADRSLKNINNTLQRIKNKKQLLTKEISVNKITEVEKSNTVPLKSETLPIHKRCTHDYNIYKKSPINYAKLPDSFYNSQIKTLKEQISKEKTKSIQKYNEPVNVDLMRYINVLLKMSPSDIDNLSISSCSSVQLEENILTHSKKNTQFYSEMLDCISKCLNSDISDINQDTTFESPKNINIISKLQELTNYYLDKAHEIKNICDEPFKILNEQSIEKEAKNFQEVDSVNISSSSSVDEEYILKHLNTLLRKKGLIKSDKEWPMFEDNSESDNSRSLTDQLLDIK